MDNEDRAPVRYYLSAGKVILEVDADIEHEWPSVAAMAISESKQRRRDAQWVQFRTDKGSFGAIPLHSSWPILFFQTADYLANVEMIGKIISIAPGKTNQEMQN